jgi:cysteinyl-tRNA synthetase
VSTYDAQHSVSGYEFSDESDDGDRLHELTRYIESLGALTATRRSTCWRGCKRCRRSPRQARRETQSQLIDLVVELREALRGAKRYDLADKARDLLDEMGIELGDTPQGARWSRR